MATQNTVEYRAKLDPSGVESGAAKAKQAIDSISAAGPAPGFVTAFTLAEKALDATAESAKATGTNLAQAGTTAQTTGGAILTAGTQGAQGMRQLSQSSKEAQDSQTRLKSAGDQFLAMLRDQVATTGKSAEELLRYRAAQSGVAAEAAPIIQQLQNQRAAQLAAAEAAQTEAAAQREAAVAKQRDQQMADAFIRTLRDQAATTGMSAEELLRYRAAQAGVAGEAAPIIQQLQNQRAAQLAAAEAARIEETAQREAAAAKQRDQQAADSFIRSLRDQAATQGLSSTELIRYRAEQLGVSAAANQYIRAIETASAANRGGAISAGQHAAAMRMLPAQMTDVVTSVASGMPVWMEAYNSLAKIVGNAPQIDVTAGFATNPTYTDESSYGYYRIINKANGELLKEYNNRELTGNSEEAFKKYVADLGKGMIDQLRTSDAPVWMNELLANLGDAPTLEALQAALQQITMIDAAFKEWNKNLAGFSAMSSQAQADLIKAAGGIQALSASVSSYYDLYYSDSEKRGNLIKNTDEEMKNKGLDLRVGDADAKAKYRALLEKAMADGDQALVAWLLQFAQQFAAGADAVTDSIKAANDAIQAEMDKIVKAREETLSTLGLSMDSLTDGFIQEVNEGRGAQAGEWLADQIAGGFEQALYGQAVNIIMSSIIDGVITPMVTAAMTGSVTSMVVSQAAIDTMVQSAQATVDALMMLLDNPQFKEAMEKVFASVRELGNGVGSSLRPMNTYRGAVASTGAAADYASSKLNDAEDAAKKLADEWLNTIKAMTDAVRSMRGEMAGQGQDGIAYWQAQLAIDTAAAKAGDKEAADRLAETAKKLADLQAANASSALEAQRAQARVAQGLEDTARFLAQKYGVKIPGFAGGGNHFGGARIVGENGPEMELTGPSRIISNERLAGMLTGDGGNSGEFQLRAIQRMHEDLLGAQISGNKLLVQILRLFESWDRRGMPPVHAAIAA
ncbi:MAG: phage tail length tape measure family protein [Comamonas sp.]